jgi:Fic family protein
MEYIVSYQKSISNWFSRRQQILPSVDAEDDRRLEDVFVFIDDFRRSTSDQKREAATKKMLEFVRIEHIHHSTTIEGNTLSRQQVRDTLDGRPVTSARGSKDCDEVLGLAQALDYIDRHVSRVEDITLEVCVRKNSNIISV